MRPPLLQALWPALHRWGPCCLLHCTLRPGPETPGKCSVCQLATGGPPSQFPVGFRPELGEIGKANIRQIWSVFCLPPFSTRRKALRLRCTPPHKRDKCLLCCISKNDQAIRLLYFKCLLINPCRNISACAFSFFLKAKLIMNVQNHSVVWIFNWPHVHYALVIFFCITWEFWKTLWLNNN